MVMIVWPLHQQFSGWDPRTILSQTNPPGRLFFPKQQSHSHRLAKRVPFFFDERRARE